MIKKKILLSAYACDPNKGSEPGIGWHWVLEIAKLGHEVWVLTREKNRKSIEHNLSTKNLAVKNQIHIIGHELSPTLLKLKKVLGVYFYYELWQYTLLKKAKSYHQKLNFDFVQHLTFGTIRQPSYLHKLNIPFVFGTLGGGEFSPPALLADLPFKYRVEEWFRKISTVVSMWRPSVNNTYKKSVIIFCRTKESKNALPGQYLNKTIIHGDLGQYKNDAKVKELPKDQEINILYSGRLVYWKGPHIAIKAFAKLLKQYPKAKLTLVGGGSYHDELSALCVDLDVCDSVNITGAIPHSEVLRYNESAHIFLFPSLHDSGGMVVFEALNNGIPAVCLGLAGPLSILTESCPTLIPYQSETETVVVEKICDMLVKLCSNNQFYNECANWSINRINELLWPKIVSERYEYIDKALTNYNF